MKTFVTIGFMLFSALQVWAADSDLFPLQRLELGMTATDLLKAYPNVKTAFVKKDASGQLAEGLVLCEIADGVYWDGALIHVRDSKVESWNYVCTKDFDHAAKNVGTIHKALAAALGDTPEKKVAFHLVKQGNMRSPMFIWKRGRDIVVFTHSPLKDHKSGEPFICQLTIASDAEALRGLVNVAKDKKDSDQKLFEEMTSGKANADK